MSYVCAFFPNAWCVLSEIPSRHKGLLQWHKVQLLSHSVLLGYSELLPEPTLPARPVPRLPWLPQACLGSPKLLLLLAQA